MPSSVPSIYAGSFRADAPEDEMRDQYAGDVSDVLKFAFLRALAGADRRLGVAWYYAPGNDGRPDGKHIEWREEPAWRKLDAKLHAGLSTLSERSIAALQRAPIWPEGSLFHGEPVPSRALRDSWAERKRASLEGADIVFLDPDNGLGAEKTKHATYSEVDLLRKHGRAIVFITFPGRNMTHDMRVRIMHDRLRVEANASSAVTLRTNVSVLSGQGRTRYVQRPRWFTIVDPDAELIVRARAFADALRLIPHVTVRFDPADGASDNARGL